MKVVVVYNRESKSVINLFGAPNQEKIGLKTIKRITDALKAGGHQVKAVEGDKDLIDKLEDFMPSVVKGERPGMVFNVSYGIQGQARYTHVPSILEMVGIPYVASGPLAHSLALDKVVSKMLFVQHGLPTADFAVLDGPETPIPELTYPMIVKPKNEAVSFGIKIVNSAEELKEAAGVIFDKFSQPVLVEQYIAGREVNVGLLGNSPPDALPPVLLQFGEGGPQIYTYEDKTRRSGREIVPVCPAPLGDELTAKVQDIAKRAFQVLGCYDCARVDFRINEEGDPFILEVNSLPSMGEHGSYVEAAQHAGLDFNGLVNRLVEVASARYFGTPAPARITTKDSEPDDVVFNYLTGRRDRIERRLKDLVNISSRTDDRVGIRELGRNLEARFSDAGLKRVDNLSKDNVAWTWQTPKGLDDGTLFICHLDVPLGYGAPKHAFRRDPDALFGEGAAISRAPLVMLEYAMRAVKASRNLRKLKAGILAYADEGHDCQYSDELIRAAAGRAARVFVVRPGGLQGELIVARRGLRRYRFTVEGRARRLGQASKKPEVLRWAWSKLEAMAALSSRKDRIAISAESVNTRAFPMLLPHAVDAEILVGYGEAKRADDAEEKMRILLGKDDYPWELELVSDRPAMKDRAENKALIDGLGRISEKWGIPLGTESALLPSVAGLVPKGTPVLCGTGPAARDPYTPQESVQRMSLLQRTLLIAAYLTSEVGG